MIHCSWAQLACRSLPIAGLAIATMVPSRATIMTPTATVRRVSHGWPRNPAAGAGPDGAADALSPGPVVSMVV
ncbi:hypothetical protein GCM10010521_06910 [Streptomyces rameus]|uniref:Secreted protein n=1 Tax=Streptomyces rameus TaxID=68261 RepID=A0ABP6MSN0_9ACTN